MSDVHQWFAHAAQCMRRDELTWLDGCHEMTRVGELELAAMQQRALQRCLRAIALYGGAILADGTGMGKTRVALALMATWLRREPTSRALLCVPSRLVPMWRRALKSAGHDDGCWTARVTVLTHYALSRHRPGSRRGALPQLVVVDEAHHFRHAHTQRYDGLARLARKAHGVLHLTASPVNSGARDLGALLALCLSTAGRRRIGLRDGLDWEDECAAQWIEHLVAEVVIRRTHVMCGEEEVTRGLKRPRQRIVNVSYEPGPAEEWLWEHLGQASRQVTLELFGGRYHPGLFVELLGQRWESGVHALSQTLARFITLHERALKLRDVRGSCPDASELREVFVDQQEVLPFMFPSHAPGRVDAAIVRADLERLEQLAAHVKDARDEMYGDLTRGRLAALAAYFAEVPHHKVLCFTSSAEAAHECWRALTQILGASDAIGLVTGAGARITGLGTCHVQEAIERFAPIAQGVEDLYRPHEQVRVMVATDCIAQGVNLQDCAKVVLLDLPNSPLGVVQRLGRFVRPGSPHEEVVVVWMRPRGWQDRLGVKSRLVRKARAAQGLHVGYEVMRTSLFDHATPQAPDVMSAQDRFERLWRGWPAPEPGQPEPGTYRCVMPAESLIPAGSGAVWVQQGNAQTGWRHKLWWVTPHGEVDERIWRYADYLAQCHDWTSVSCDLAHDAAHDERLVEEYIAIKNQHAAGRWWAPFRLCSTASEALARLNGVPGAEPVTSWLMAKPLREGTRRMLQHYFMSARDDEQLLEFLREECEHGWHAPAGAPVRIRRLGLVRFDSGTEPAK